MLIRIRIAAHQTFLLHGYDYLHMYYHMTYITRYDALMQVRRFFPTERAMADALGVSQPTIWRWLNQTKQLPPEKVLLAEKLTGVSRHLLRPDIYPAGPHVPSPVFLGIDHGLDTVTRNRCDILQGGAA